MTWLKADDRLFDNPKVVAVRAHAKLLYVVGLCYCAGGLTDGQIAASALGLLCTKAGLPRREGPPLAAELVAAGLWEPAADGFAVHDYLAYNPSRAQVLAEREREAARKAAGRANGAGRRAAPVGPQLGPRPEIGSPPVRPDSGGTAPSVRPESGGSPAGILSSRPGPARPGTGTPSGLIATDPSVVSGPVLRGVEGGGEPPLANPPLAWDAAETGVAIDVWTRAAPRVQANLSAGNWSAFLADAAPLGVRDGELVLRVRNGALLDQAARFVPLIARELRGLGTEAPHDVRLVANDA